MQLNKRLAATEKIEARALNYARFFSGTKRSGVCFVAVFNVQPNQQTKPTPIYKSHLKVPNTAIKYTLCLVPLFLCQLNKHAAKGLGTRIHCEITIGRGSWYFNIFH